MIGDTIAVAQVPRRKVEKKKWPCLLFYNDLVRYRRRCRRYSQKYMILLNGKWIHSSTVFRESHVTSPQVCNIRYELEFYVFTLLTENVRKAG